MNRASTILDGIFYPFQLSLDFAAHTQHALLLSEVYRGSVTQHYLADYLTHATSSCTSSNTSSVVVQVTQYPPLHLLAHLLTAALLTTKHLYLYAQWQAGELLERLQARASTGVLGGMVGLAEGHVLALANTRTSMNTTPNSANTATNATNNSATSSSSSTSGSVLGAYQDSATQRDGLDLLLAIVLCIHDLLPALFCHPGSTASKAASTAVGSGGVQGGGVSLFDEVDLLPTAAVAATAAAPDEVICRLLLFVLVYQGACNVFVICHTMLRTLT